MQEGHMAKDFAKLIWRVIITDSENADGIAPVCSQQTGPGGLHEWYEPGVAMGFDEQSVFDCCPFPQLELGSPGDAQALVKLLNVLPLITPLVVAARNWVHAEGDTGALEALVEASDKMPWSVLDALGIKEDDDG